jgi:predicted phosphodiesterase
VRYLILSDIHSNWEALQAVLDAAEGLYEKVLCCGDLIGYGADPNAVIEWTRANVAAIVRGNHDKAGVDLSELEWFNPVAQTATVWTHNTLTPENIEYVRNLPTGPLAVEDFHLVHGSPLNEDEYLVELSEAAEAFSYLPSPIVFFGHTHLQGGFEAHRRRVLHMDAGFKNTMRPLNPDSAYLINPGSVGQPRDQDPQAAYIIFDAESRALAFCRTPYDLGRAQAKIRQAGLPPILADRLAIGR